LRSKRAMKWNSWALITVGAWLITAPWILGYASYNLVTWNSIAAGSMVIVLTLWNMAQ